MRHRVPSDGCEHILLNNGADCECDPFIDWNESLVVHQDMRRQRKFDEQLLKEADTIRERAGKGWLDKLAARLADDGP
jgi:hypothetical protein